MTNVNKRNVASLRIMSYNLPISLTVFVVMEEASENADGEEEHARDTVQDTVPDEVMKY